MVPPGEVRTGADVEVGQEAQDAGLKPADIDAYWLQRNVSKAYGNLDENEAVKKAEEVFNALQVFSFAAHQGVHSGFMPSFLLMVISLFVQKGSGNQMKVYCFSHRSYEVRFHV